MKGWQIFADFLTMAQTTQKRLKIISLSLARFMRTMGSKFVQENSVQTKPTKKI